MRSMLWVSCVLVACSGGIPVVGGRVPDAVDDLAPLDVPVEGPDDRPDAHLSDGVASDGAFDDSLDAGIDVTTELGMDTPSDPAGEPPFRCASSADCAAMAATPVCDVTSGRCVRCTPVDDRCPADQHCDGVTLACVAGCRADEGCAMGRRCDVTAHACVECVTDVHCPAGRVCMGRACVPGCNATQPCAAGDTCCAMACVDTRTSVEHCGACGARCEVPHATARCASGRCAIERCAEFFGDCDGDVANGCEVDTRSTLAHCGACGRTCAPGPNQVATCSAGVCALRCNAGFADCDGDPSNGCEADTRTSVAHCGACRNACAVANGTPTCRAGRCEVATCGTGFADCDGDPSNGCEADTRTSVAHCGICGRACGAGETCVAGSCTIPLEVTGCARGGGGTAAGANVFREFCRVRGRVGVIAGALATAASTTLRIPLAGLPAEARILRAFLYRQTYDSTGTYLSTWTLLGSNLTTATDFIGTSTTSPVQVARAEFTELLRAAPMGADGVRALPLTQAPNTSSGGFGWWVLYEAPSLPERTVIVYDGMHTDVMGGNGAFSFGGFRASHDPPVATFHVYGGGDNANDTPSVAHLNPGTPLVVHDITDPRVGNYAGVTSEALDDRMGVGAMAVSVEFSLRNYSAVSFAILEVETGAMSTACSPACPMGQSCVSGRCFPSEGCRLSMRRGFTDRMRFPAIAACGPRTTFDEATSLSSNVCASGWRPCTADDINALGADTPDFLTPGSFGWVLWVDGSTERFGEFAMARCGGGALALANLRGTGPCTPAGVFPEGWRLAVDASTWQGSHARTGPCVQHAIHRCAYPGGSVAQQRGHTLCCR